jgi:hypothetical protein
MNVHRKGWDDAIKLRLRMGQRTTDELLAMLGARDPESPRRYSHDKKTRNAIEAVLRFRGALAERLK